MKKKVLVIGAAATAVLLIGGWALAQTAGHGPGSGPPFMRGEGMGPGMMMRHMGHGMGPGMMQHGMGSGMHGMGAGMGPGMMMQGMGRGMGPGMMPGGPGLAFADPTQIESLKKQLDITTAQDAPWSKYVKTLQDAAAAMKATRETVDPATASKMTTQDRIAFVTRIREQALKQFETVKTAADELLATLDDQQKAKALEILPGLAFGPGPMRGAFMGGPQHHH